MAVLISLAASATALAIGMVVRIVYVGSGQLERAVDGRSTPDDVQ